ncbi:MAG: S8 family serine peptidase [Candidatus Cryptobacteroides sp.]
MKKTSISALMALMVVLFSCVKENNSPHIPVGEAPESCMIEGLADVFVSEELARIIEDTGIPDAFLQCGVISFERTFPDDPRWEQRHRDAGLHRWYKAQFEPALTKSVMSEGNLPGVEIFEPSRRIRQTVSNLKGFPFNDPYGARYQWHIVNDGLQWGGYVAGADLNVAKVYSEYTGGSADVLVAVVDGGVDMSHPDLAGVVLPAGPEGSRNLYRNSYSIEADEHGTHVAGIIGAINNNKLGGCGVAGGTDGNGGVTMMSCQVFGSSGQGAGFENALVWAADNGAIICNNSWGYEYNSEEDARNAVLPSALKVAIDYFIDNAGCDSDGNQVGLMKGGLVTFAAGNEGWKYCQPASYSKVMAVGAIGPDGRRATYSNYGEWVDICAPGGESDRFKGGAASDGSSFILSTSPGGKYIFMCGTSQSCPMVSGVAALVLSVHGGPGYTNTDLWEALINSANYDLVPASDEVGPLVDAYAAVSYGNTTPELASDAKDLISGRTLEEGESAEAVIRKPGDKLTLDPVLLFSDEDGDVLSYSFECDNSLLVNFSVEGGKIVLQGRTIGTGHCTLKATDSFKASATLEFDLAVFDDSEGPALYPNPVKNEYFFVSPGMKQEIEVELYGASGSLLQKVSAQASVFNPLKIEMPKYAPGSYVAISRYGDKTYKTKIVKL